MSTTHLDTRDDHSGDPAETAVPADGIRTFAIVWSGQFLAVTSLTVLNFAAAFYVYQSYSSIFLGVVFALPFIPFLVTSPIAGSAVDRWGPRRALLVSNIGGVVLAATVAVPLLTRDFPVWHGFVVIAAVPVLKALLLPALEASVSLLVPKRHIGRANGTRMLVNGAGAALGPIVAGLLLEAFGIRRTGLLAALCLGVAVFTLAVVRIPKAGRDDAATAGVRVLLSDFAVAWRHVRSRPGLMSVVIFFGVISFGIGFVEVLITGLVLAFASPMALAAVLAVGVLGMAVMGITMTVWGGPNHRVKGMLGYSLLFAAAIVMASLRPNLALISVAAFLFLGSTSFIVGNVHTILNIKVEPYLLGRVMGLKNLVYAGLLMVGNVTAGVVSGVVQPLVGQDRVGSPIVATVVGDGPGRGSALLMLVAGVLIALCTLYAYRQPRLRNVEEVLPDVTPEDLARATARR